MHTMKKRLMWAVLLGVALAGLAALAVPAADEPAKADSDVLVVTDNAGKEQKLKEWKFTSGTRRLAWLAPKDKPMEGPEALEIRELDSTTFTEGVLTLVPLDRLRAAEYDVQKEAVKLTVATGPKDSDVVTLNGSTGFKGGMNRPTFEGATTMGGEKIKFVCGVEKSIKAAKFPPHKIEAQPLGRLVELTTRRDGNDPTTHKIGDFQPLYTFADGHAVLSPKLYCKTLTTEMAKVIHIMRSRGEADETVWIISRKGAADETERVLPTVMIDGKEATLAGFVGRVPAGYKLIPALIIQEVEFDVK
jgi:hypothetical protein